MSNKVKFEDLEDTIGPRVLTLPEGVHLLKPAEFGEQATYKVETAQKYSEKEIARMSAVLQFIGTEFITAKQWIAISVLLTGAGVLRPIKRVQENRTTARGLFRIPLHVLPKDIVKAVMSAKKEMIAKAKAEAKSAPKPDIKPEKSAPATKPKPVKKPVKSAPINESVSEVSDAADNDGVPVPNSKEDFEVLTAAE